MSVTCKFTKSITFIHGKDTYTAMDWARALIIRLALMYWGRPICATIRQRPEASLRDVDRDLEVARSKAALLYGISPLD